ncbi:uncharacterized protein EURHEDRAFT_244745 [Aspergillus ruber CBS 135680]|uniref:Uncharacterized protein n=1 Tax=Aspergillus ruber (strain CBS 135680) TaxID=1388766 RepID=A0A017S333_ASPRC|nr:uncharacterized protein EURHEDRAFT_244745 [Aspergillus ruber CBS 135680]EYE91443.1 hypothetical protein EURHEDRAFT_244745 [Aspergillus ruber CBS 135680]
MVLECLCVGLSWGFSFVLDDVSVLKFRVAWTSLVHLIFFFFFFGTILARQYLYGLSRLAGFVTGFRDSLNDVWGLRNQSRFI